MKPQQKAVKKVLVEWAGDNYPITCKKDGTIVIKDSYFYRHNRTPEAWAAKVMQVVGDICELVEARDEWAQWPKTSYFVAVIRPKA